MYPSSLLLLFTTDPKEFEEPSSMDSVMNCKLSKPRRRALF